MGTKRFKNGALAALLVVASGCYEGSSSDEEAFELRLALEDAGLRVWVAHGHRTVELTTDRLEDDTGISVIPSLYAGDGTAISRAWLDSLSPELADAWEITLDRTADALDEVVLDDVSREPERRTLLGALRRVLPPAEEAVATGFRDKWQHMRWVEYSDYPFTVDFAFEHYEGDPICSKWRSEHHVVFEWANRDEAFVDWHGTTYFVDEGIVIGGQLFGYGGPGFHSSDTDWSKGYTPATWGATHWKWIGATVPVGTHNQTIVFDKLWAEGDYGYYGVCGGVDQSVTVFPG